MKLPSKVQNNRVAVFLVGAVGGIGGSALTGLWVVSGVWAAILLAARRLKFKMASSDLLLVWAATIYFIMNVVSAVVNDGVPRDFFVLYPVLVFLLPWFVIPRLRLSEGGDLIGGLAFGVAFCGVLALPIAVYQVTYIGVTRAEGGAGNPIPFAMVTCLAAQISLINLVYQSLWRKLLGWVGYVAGFACVVLSVTKGVVPSLVIGPLILIAVFPQVRAVVLNWKAAVAAVLILAALAYFSEPLYSKIGEPLYARFVEAYASLTGGAVDESTGARLALWQKSLGVFSDSPILGHGTQHRTELVRAMGFDYGHLHNGFINSAVDSGLLGLVAMMALLVSPVVIAIKAMGGPHARERLFLALVLTSTYVIGGLTNYIFWHDIYDTLFLWLATIIAVSVPISPSNPLVGARKA